MATKRSREGSGAERSDRGNDLWNKEADLGEQVQESATGPHDTTGVTLENFAGTLETLASLSRAKTPCLCASARRFAWRVCARLRTCGRLCVSGWRSKADVSSGEENPRNWLLYH